MNFLTQPFLWIDFLGFRELMLKEPDKLERMPEVLFENALPSGVLDYPELYHFIIISDTMVICPGEGRPDGESVLDQFRDISHIGRLMLGKSIQNRFPLRGTLAFGNLAIMTKHGQSMALGAGVVDAHNFESAQNWVGIAISPESLRLLRLESEDLNIGGLMTECGLKYYNKIPLKKMDMDGYAVWPHGDPDLLVRKLKEKMLESNIGSRIKYQNSIQYMKYFFNE